MELSYGVKKIYSYVSGASSCSLPRAKNENLFVGVAWLKVMLEGNEK
jgi:hypothetical protein